MDRVDKFRYSVIEIVTENTEVYVHKFQIKVSPNGKDIEKKASHASTIGFLTTSVAAPVSISIHRHFNPAMILLTSASAFPNARKALYFLS